MSAPSLSSAEVFRSEFPLLASSTYLATCSLGARSRRLVASLDAMFDVMRRGADAWSEFERQIERSRALFARLINASPDDIAIVPSATVGAYQAASTLPVGPRDRIVATGREFPSVAHVWLAQRARGKTTAWVDDRIPATEPLEVGHFARQIDERAALVSIPFVAYERGMLMPVREVSELAHAAGARVFVDAYQAAGIVPIDVAGLGCDYLVAGAQKFLVGLPGIAFLYVSPKVVSNVEPVLTGMFGRREPERFDSRTLDYAPTARRFETGTAAVPTAYGVAAGLELINTLDLSAVRLHVGRLMHRCLAQLEEVGGVRLPADVNCHGGHFGFETPDPARLARQLATAGVLVAPRGAVIRTAFHYYNDESDIDALCAAVAGARRETRGL